MLDVNFKSCKLSVELIEVGASRSQGGELFEVFREGKAFPVDRLAAVKILFDVPPLLISEL